jgi:hypothetical protein
VISRRHMHLVIALLLPLMVLRVMLPNGYMPVAGNGTLRIAMCSDGLYPAATDQVIEQAPGGAHDLPADSGNCVFANAAVHAPPPAITQSIVTTLFDAGIIPASAAPTHAASIVRVQSARGPPSLSV